jgi:hypothetical protein
MESYTTAAIIQNIDPKDTTKIAIEQKKTIITDDAYAIADLLEKLAKQLELNRTSTLS